MIRLLAHAPLRTQLILMFAVAPFVLVTFGLTMVPATTELAFGDGDTGAAADAVRAVTWVVVGVAGAACLAAVGAAMSLYASIAGTIQKMREVTDAVARGQFDQRISSLRHDELGDLAGSIDRMAEQLLRLEQARRRLLAAVSHELRTPLTIIRGIAWTLSRTEVDASRQTQFGLIDAESERLADLISELLSAAHMHANGVQVELQIADLALVVADVADRFSQQANARSLQLSVRGIDDPVIGNLDVPRIHQVLANIIDNALRHACEGTTVGISVANVTCDSATIMVENSGDTIPDNMLDSIFQPFVQIGTRSGSIGLGLAIARDIMRAHGGDITCQSRRGATTFCATFSLAASRGIVVPATSSADMSHPQPICQIQPSSLPA